MLKRKEKARTKHWTLYILQGPMLILVFSACVTEMHELHSAVMKYYKSCVLACAINLKQILSHSYCMCNFICLQFLFC